MYNETITFYSKTPPNRWTLDDYDVKHYEDNAICWDDLEIYLKIDNNIVVDFSFDWDTAIITTACASIFWESIIWMDINEVLLKDFDYMEDLVWMTISPRRRQAAVLGLLTTINAIHKYIWDWIVNDFDDIID